MATLGANRQKNHAVTNVFFSAFLIPVGISRCSAKVLMQVAENCSFLINQNQILPDAEFWCSIEYLLHVNMVLLAVLTVCRSALLQRDEMSFVFNVCAAFRSTVGKSCQCVEKHFSSILKHLLNIVNVFTMDWVTLQMRLKPLSTRCNALSMHLKCMENALQRYFVKPGFPKWGHNYVPYNVNASNDFHLLAPPLLLVQGAKLLYTWCNTRHILSGVIFP